MFDRRMHPRFLFNAPLESTLLVTEDVIVERVVDDEVWVVSDAPGRPEERLTVDRIGSAPPMVLGVRVVGSDPVMVHGKLRHRLRLAVQPSGDWAEGMAMHGGLVRTLPVRMVDVSRGGCLLQSDIPVEPGVEGELRVKEEGTECWDPLRVSRCVHVEGAGPRYRIGAEFVKMQPPERFGVRLNGARTDPAALDRLAGERA